MHDLLPGVPDAGVLLSCRADCAEEATEELRQNAASITGAMAAQHAELLAALKVGASLSFLASLFLAAARPATFVWLCKQARG